MKFEINQEVMELKSGKRCIILATKDQKGKKNREALDNSEVFPDDHKDYMIAIKVSEKELGQEMHVDEHQLFAL
ncbi:hypothetical protein [Frigoriflavimonas asaccharolytica]|uniref:Uncharacterized protein n=1 Tax=Frigoriflavimonas asaccharolytica TaxID=2735899 RepID=A0A8J8K7A0_9FLAO|nr:hypothetical protein [Frigoriflavimonas asaccharolytica]NRS91758.1 hypothetical protein [Frigoriflavimonas asaccharolytica]